MGILGFSTESSNGSGGDFTPIVKYDARSGRIFRIDRIDTGNGYANEPVDITAIFKAVFDFETVLTGWMDFPPGSAPSFALVPLSLDQSKQVPLPDRPGPKHKHGTKTMIKLSPSCGGDKPVREIAGTSKAYVGAYEALFAQYLAERSKYPGQLPVVALQSTMPVTTGSGQQKSTNYHPQWRIDGWKPRPADMPLTIRQPAVQAMQPLPLTPPATGNQTVPPPNRYQQPAAIVPQATTISDDDFG
jgi:hypothetical protein